MKLIPILLIAMFALSGCAYFGKDDINVEESWQVERVYAEAKAALNGEEFDSALIYYSQIEARFPFGIYAQQSLLESAYAQYKLDESDLAIAGLDSFLQGYPLHANIDYAHYLRGLINFNREMGFFARYLTRDESQRDPGSARAALQDFNTLISRHPNSKYVPDAVQRVVYLRNRLARHEVNLATYYMRRNSYLAAANRGRYVLENYPRTPAVPDALVVMAKAYKVMSLPDLARDAMRVLKQNYPGHPNIANIERTILVEK